MYLTVKLSNIKLLMKNQNKTNQKSLPQTEHVKSIQPIQFHTVERFVHVITKWLFAVTGLGPNPWTINSEIYPLWARGTGTSLATCVNWIGNLIVSFTFLLLLKTITTYGRLCHVGVTSLFDHVVEWCFYLQRRYLIRLVYVYLVTLN